MKRLLTVFLVIALLGTLTACGSKSVTDTSGVGGDDATVSVAEAVTDTTISAAETTGAFSIKSNDGTVSTDDNAYRISAAGTYTLQGAIQGQVLIAAGEEDAVTLELNGVTVTCGEDSPIKIVSAGSVEIVAKSGSENVINDTRSAKATDSDEQGGGAIDAACDLKLKGSGTLVVNAGYNNGVHTTKDLTIQELSLKVTAVNNALKGNDSVTVASGAVVAISTHGDGVRTKNTDVNKSGVTRGDITVTGGAVTVYAAGDGFQAAHNFTMEAGDDGTAPTVVIYTGSYSGYTAADSSASSYKGVKAKNELNVAAGSLTIQSDDDGLHADAGTSFDDGTTGKETVTVTGGAITMSVYAPQTKTAGNRMGGPPDPWGGQQAVVAVSGADAIHADGTLTIAGGTITVDSAYEGLEANVINIAGGKTCIAANDDGVNACKGAATPQINVTGGYLEVAVPANGDTDGIDSNGSYTQSGGVVITKGPNSDMAAAIDADGSVTVTGGTLIVLGYGRVRTGGSVKTYSLSLHTAGKHTVTVNGTAYTFTNASAYGRTLCYSDGSVSF